MPPRIDQARHQHWHGQCFNLSVCQRQAYVAAAQGVQDTEVPAAAEYWSQAICRGQQVGA